MIEYTKEEKELMLEELIQHREKMFQHLGSIENLVKCIGHGIDRDRMDAYWLPSIKGSLGDEMYPNTIMISMADTIKDLEEGLKEESEEEILPDSDPQEDDAEFEEHEEQVFRDAKLEEEA